MPAESPTAPDERLASEVDAARARVAELERLRAEYLRNVSHEFRTPLTLLRGYAEYLRDSDGTLEAAAIRSIAETMVESCDRVIELVDTMLEVGRIEGDPGQRALRLQQLDLVALVRSVTDAVMVRIPRGYRQLALELPEAPLPLEGDAALIARAVRQLVDNAIKFSADGGTVKVAARGDGEDVVCAVEDAGSGIAPEHTERIFEKYFMIDGGLDRRRSGTGVGLYLARQAVRLHGGTLSVESRPGQGSTFTIRLPRAQRAP